MFGFGPTQIIIVLVIVLLVFGAKRLPEMGRSLGRGMREFRSSVSGDEPPAPGIAEADPVDVERAAAGRTPGGRGDGR